MSKKQNMTIAIIENGEIVNTIDNVTKVITDSQDKFFTDTFLTKMNKNQFKNKVGDFFFMTTNYKELINSEKIVDSDIVRLIYLATFIDYDGKLVNEDGSIMSKHDVKNKLDCSINIFYAFYNKCLSEGILIEKDGCLFLKDEIFKKGAIKISDNSRKSRIMVNGVRYLFENCATNNLKHLGLVFNLLPYINYEWNILCVNPEQTDPTLIKELTLADISAVFQFTQSRAKDVLNILSKWMINDLHVFGYYGAGNNVNNFKVAVNPMLIYGGSIGNLDATILLFKESSKKINTREERERRKKLIGHSFEDNKRKKMEKKIKNESLKPLV